MIECAYQMASRGICFSIRRVIAALSVLGIFGVITLESDVSVVSDVE